MGLLKALFVRLFSLIFFFFIGGLSLKRGFMVFNEHARIAKDIADDQYYCNTTCAHPEAGTRLGKRTSHCAEACEWKTRSAWGEAFYVMLSKTYLCGDEKCLHIFQEAAQSWRTVLMTLLVMVVLPVLGMYLVNSIGHKLGTLWTARESNARSKQDPRWAIDDTSGAVMLDLSAK
jgi:hypothetical protein